MRTANFVICLLLIGLSRYFAADNGFEKLNKDHIESFRFSQKEIDFLKTNGFVIISKHEPAGNFNDVYQYNLDHGIPNYVTIDSILNTTSKIIHKYLWFVETEHLYPDTVLLTKALYQKSLEYYKDIKNPLLKKAALDNVCFFAVALALDDENISLLPEIKSKVAAEIELIKNARGINKSPVFQVNDDYSLYAPGGYYRDSEHLRKYYKIIEWFNGKGFTLETDISRELKSSNILHNARCSLLIYLAINEGKTNRDKTKDMWAKINQLYSLFFQRDGRYNYNDYDNVCFKIFGGPVSIIQLEQDSLIEKFLFELKTYRKYSIKSLPSQYVFLNGRVFFNKYLLSIQKEPVDFSEVMKNFFDLDGVNKANADMIKIIKSMDENYWWTSLEIRKKTWDGIFASFKSNGPLGVNDSLWNKRIYFTSLGAWIDMTGYKLAGIKSAVRMGNIKSGDIKYTRGFIDPYPEIYRAEKEAVKMLLNKLAPYKYLTEKAEDNLNEYISLLEFLAKLAEKEIEAKNPINAEEYRVIWKIGYKLKELSALPDKHEKALFYETEQTLAQIVLMGENTQKQNIEAGLGKPLFMYVLIPDGPGYAVSCGPVYSYYEFLLPPGKTIDDDDWTELLSQRSPVFPSWIKDMIFE
ncbi:MAG: DUF3160 domain-containing protein [bacterium]